MYNFSYIYFCNIIFSHSAIRGSEGFICAFIYCFGEIRAEGEGRLRLGVIGKPRVSKGQDSQMSTDRQHIGTQFPPEAIYVLIKGLQTGRRTRSGEEVNES